MKTGFTPIQLREYVELHLRANPEVERTELIPRFAFFVEGGVVHVPLAVSRHWRGLPVASPEGWACAYALMGELDEPALRARRAERATLLFDHLGRTGADASRLEAMLAQPLPAPLAARLRALPRADRRDPGAST